MSFLIKGPLETAEARQMNPLRLAYIGDTVWDMLVRTKLMYLRHNLRHMHAEAVAQVNAAAQAACLVRCEEVLTAEEHEIVLRGRNAHSKHPVPKNQQASDYQAATGLEALMGYLYLTGQQDRLQYLFDYCHMEETHE